MKEYKVTVDSYGNICWYKVGTDILHREDGPAIEGANGTKYWYKDGEYHREDGPAFECANGNKLWYKEGKLHREDGPAIEHASGSKFWYLEGKEYTESEFLKKTSQKDSCEGKVVEIEGKKYILKSLDK